MTYPVGLKCFAFGSNNCKAVCIEPIALLLGIASPVHLNSTHLLFNPFKIHIDLLGFCTSGFGRVTAGALPAWRPTSAKSQGHWLCWSLMAKWSFRCLMSVPNRCSARNSLRLTCLGKISTPVCLALIVSDHSSLRNFFSVSSTTQYGTRREPLSQRFPM